MIYLEENDNKVIPAFDKDNISIAFESSEYFVPYLSVAIASLLAHVSEFRNYDIILFSSGIKEQDEAELLKLCDGMSNVSIRLVDPTQMVRKYIESARYNYLVINYYRMALPWILSEYSKVINLGADLLVEQDIAELFQINLEDSCYLAGAPDIAYQGKLRGEISPRELSLSDPQAYINSDVLLLELDKIRRDFTQDELMEFWQKRYFRHAEQDALNVLFDKRIQHLDLKWNVFADKMDSETDILHASETSIRIWRESLRTPYIIHFSSGPKPWDSPDVGFGNRWWQIAERSSYYDELVHRKEIGREPKPKSFLDSVLDYLFPKRSRGRRIIKKIVPFDSPLWWISKKIKP